MVLEQQLKGFLEILQANPDVNMYKKLRQLKIKLLMLLRKQVILINITIQKKGYSGVAILSKIKPNSVFYGTGIEHMDFEDEIFELILIQCLL
jgi:exodeoxyribonuclease-3